MLTVPVPLILFDICLLKFTNKSIKYIRFFITLPHINAEVTMNKKLKSLLQQLLQSPRRFPVELALGVVFFIIAVWDSESREWSEKAGEFVSAVNGDILWFFVPLMALTFWLHRVNRWAYLASFFLFLPLMALNLKSFLWTYGFTFTYVLAAILLIIGNRRLDNRSFAAHALHVVTQMFFGLLISGILHMAVMAIMASFFYIFGIDEPKHFYEHIAQFIFLVLAPQICCTLVRQNEDGATDEFFRFIVFGNACNDLNGAIRMPDFHLRAYEFVRLFHFFGGQNLVSCAVAVKKIPRFNRYARRHAQDKAVGRLTKRRQICPPQGTVALFVITTRVQYGGFFFGFEALAVR